jgi:hypothetical protein
MYYVETRADNSGYTNHMVICLVVIGSSFEIGIEMKLNIPLQYQMGNPLQQDR